MPTPLREAKRMRINEFVQHNAPEFRPVVKHFPEILDSIGAELSDDAAFYNRTKSVHSQT
jgi:hypothetical protein